MLVYFYLREIWRECNVSVNEEPLKDIIIWSVIDVLACDDGCQHVSLLSWLTDRWLLRTSINWSTTPRTSQHIFLFTNWQPLKFCHDFYDKQGVVKAGNIIKSFSQTSDIFRISCISNSAVVLFYFCMVIKRTSIINIIMFHE